MNVFLYRLETGRQAILLVFLCVAMTATSRALEPRNTHPITCDSCDEIACHGCVGQDACADSLLGQLSRPADWFDCGSCNSPGTLFRWSDASCLTGGPDLSQPLVTDRPDFTEASSTVGLGVAQVEFGYTYIEDDEGPASTQSHTYPETLLRYGILRNWLEFRVAYTYAEESIGVVNQSGSEDLYLGLKIGLTPQHGLAPEMALIPQMLVPTGSSEFTKDQILPGLNWIYGWELSDFLGTAGSTQFNRTIDEGSGDAYTEWAQSWTVAASLTDRLGAYSEWFAFFPHSADTADVEHYFNGGFTYLFNNDVQWDIRGGMGLNRASDDYFVGTGLSIRFR